MRRLRRMAGLAGAAGLGLALAGCVGPTALKPMLEDSEGYSARYFQLDRLSPGGKAVLAPPGSEPLGFRRLTAKGRVQVSGTGQPDTHRIAVFERTLINDRNDGTVREIELRTVDGLPLLVLYGLSYRGVAQLAVQQGQPARNLALPILALRSSSSWKSMAGLQENTAYDYVDSYGTGDPLMPSIKIERHCKSGTFYDAGKFLAGLPGQAIDLVCDDINSGGAKVSENRFVWLGQYGVVLPARLTTLNGITEMQYDSVTAQ
ncbi:MAG TPA: hypothetical protein VGC69_11645 [Bordetella sp.]